MRAIDGDRLKRKAQKVATEAWKMKTKATVEVILNQFIDWINDAPTIEPERKKGRWVFVRKVSPVYNYQGVKLWGNEYRCSCCGYRDMAIENFKSCAFCPNCGIEMEVE